MISTKPVRTHVGYREQQKIISRHSKSNTVSTTKTLFWRSQNNLILFCLCGEPKIKNRQHLTFGAVQPFLRLVQCYCVFLRKDMILRNFPSTHVGCSIIVRRLYVVTQPQTSTVGVFWFLVPHKDKREWDYFETFKKCLCSGCIVWLRVAWNNFMLVPSAQHVFLQTLSRSYLSVEVKNSVVWHINQILQTQTWADVDFSVLISIKGKCDSDRFLKIWGGYKLSDTLKYLSMFRLSLQSKEMFSLHTRYCVWKVR